MRTYKVYNSETGDLYDEIQIEGSLPHVYFERGESIIEFAGSREDHYVDITHSPPLVRRREKLTGIEQDKTQIMANGLDYASFMGLPPDSMVEIKEKAAVLSLHEPYRVEDGGLQWGTTAAGDYEIIINVIGFYPWKGQVKAIESSVQAEG